MPNELSLLKLIGIGSFRLGVGRFLFFILTDQRNSKDTTRLSLMFFVRLLMTLQSLSNLMLKYGSIIQNTLSIWMTGMKSIFPFLLRCSA